MKSRVWTGVMPWLGAFAVATAAPPTHTSDARVQRGRQLAELICASCHVVAHDQEFPPFLKAPTPSFYEVADRPGVTARSLRHFITTTHWDEKTIPMAMPDQSLTPEQVDAVVRYILSLRGQ